MEYGAPLTVTVTPCQLGCQCSRPANGVADTTLSHWVGGPWAGASVGPRIHQLSTAPSNLNRTPASGYGGRFRVCIVRLRLKWARHERPVKRRIVAPRPEDLNFARPSWSRLHLNELIHPSDQRTLVQDLAAWARTDPGEFANACAVGCASRLSNGYRRTACHSGVVRNRVPHVSRAVSRRI